MVLAVLMSACGLTPPRFDESAWRAAVDRQEGSELYAPNFKDGTFFNPWMPMQKKRFTELLRWRFSEKADYSVEERTFMPSVIPGLEERIANLGNSDFIAWIGHATFLFRIDGVFWLTDPMFSKRALLPARKTPPAVGISFLEGIRAPLRVIVSHNHYDHLDKASIEALPGHARIYVPSGLGDYVQAVHDGEVREMGWWERIDLGTGTSLTSLPAQHWSRRIGQAFNATLWSGYLIETSNVSIYYGGDSGYFVGFREIGRRYPGIDYALVPLTAYHPRWFMHYAHMNAAESIRAFEDLGAEYFIPTQWGTFQLGDNPPGFPIVDLRRTLRRMGRDPAPFLVMDVGEILEIASDGSPCGRIAALKNKWQRGDEQ
jgi:L-ascorbate metabolism protein UlaG (beta-lactamase superfamily)